MENPIPQFTQSNIFPSPSASNASSGGAPGASEPLMHKNRLQEYAQRAALPLPMYQTFNEGTSHAPRFRATVLVDGTSYTSVNTFSNRKAAEQDVAKLALESLPKKIKDEGCPLVREDTVFCKAILNEFAVKMNMQMPAYNTVQSEGLLPLFVSSLVFNGVTYSGETARTKKEAEQLAARAALPSLLGDSKWGMVLSAIIKSKSKLFGALNKTKDSSISSLGTQPVGALPWVHNNKEVETAQVTNDVETRAIQQPSAAANTLIHNTKEVEAAAVTNPVSTTLALQPSLRTDTRPTTALEPRSSGKRPHHEFKIPKVEESSEWIDLPIGFVPASVGQPSGAGSSSKRPRNKKKAKPQLGTQ